MAVSDDSTTEKTHHCITCDGPARETDALLCDRCYHGGLRDVTPGTVRFVHGNGQITEMNNQSHASYCTVSKFEPGGQSHQYMPDLDDMTDYTEEEDK